MSQTYTNVFGNDAVPPAGNSFASVSLTADTTFSWPQLATGSALMADIMEVTATSTYAMTFPAASAVGTGTDVLVRNVGANTITLKDNAGGVIGTVAAGVAKYLYLTDNSTAAGTWAIFTFGTGTSAADASALAGYGLVATGAELSQQSSVAAKAADYTVTGSDRASTVTFANSGVVTCSLPAAASTGNGFFVAISNQGTGTVTIDPNSTELIDGVSTKDLAPGESLFLVCNATGWVSVGYGRSTEFQFTKLVLDVSSGSPFTLTSTQAQNKLLQFIGTVTGAVTVNVPAVVAVYYTQSTYSGAFNLTVKTASGSGVTLAPGDRAILYCDGANVVSAQTASTPASNISGGAAGQVVYQTGVGATGFSATGIAGQVFVSGGVGAPGWSDLGLVTDSYSSKATPVDADEFPLADSAATFGPKKLTWANLKATMFAAWGALVAAATTKATPVDGDFLGIADSAAGNATKSLSWANLKATLAATLGALAGNNTWTGTQTFRDNKFEITDDGDTTKKVVFQASGITTATTRTLTVPDANITLAGTNAAQTFSSPQRGTMTTDNDLSFDLSATNYFVCTPTAGGTLTFTNIPTGQPVAIKLVNGSNYAIAAHANTKISSADLARISATGTYLITGLADGTNVYLQASTNIA